jgi:threonine dehydrogenase-like Zn-dependent dehydrogenase
VGICGTDHHAFGGTQNFFSYPRVLGHELAVEVLAVGRNVSRVAPGDHCAVLPYLSCGECRSCGRQRANCCERIDVLGVTVDGGLRERMVVPQSHLFPGPGLSLDQLVLVETLGIGWHAVARAALRMDDTVLILGAGPIGLAVSSAVQGQVARLLVADTAPARVAFARATGLEAFTVDQTMETRVLDELDGTLPSVVFDATGNRTSMEAAFNLIGPCGTLVLVGHTRGPITFQNPGFHARELDVKASRNATVADWGRVLKAVREGGIDALGWINHRSTLPGIVDDLPRLAANPGAVVKAVVEIGADGGSSR